MIAQVCHKCFVNLLQDGTVKWSNQLPLIMQITGKLGVFVESDGSDLATAETLCELSAILKQIHARVDQIVIQQHLATLSSNEYNGYISILTNY